MARRTVFNSVIRENFFNENEVSSLILEDSMDDPLYHAFHYN